MFASSLRAWSRQLSTMTLASAALATMTSCLVAPTVTLTARGDGKVDEPGGKQCDQGTKNSLCVVTPLTFYQ